MVKLIKKKSLKRAIEVNGSSINKVEGVIVGRKTKDSGERKRVRGENREG